MSNAADTTHEVAGVAIPEGGPFAFPFHLAIPSPNGGMVYATAAGMELRDWFAGQVAAGIVANQRTAGEPGDVARMVAEYSYAIADAMMRVRGGK